MKFRITNHIADSLNGYALGNEKEKTILDFLCHAHRFIQGEMFHWIMRYIQYNAIHYEEEPKRWFDGRNEYVGKISKEICDNCKSMEISPWVRNYHEENLKKLMAMPNREYEGCRE